MLDLPVAGSRMICHPKVFGDRTKCQQCGTEWDTNDPWPPACGYIRSLQNMADLPSIVRTAEGDAKEFYGFVSKFIVSHPKASAIGAFVIGNLIGALFGI